MYGLPINLQFYQGKPVYTQFAAVPEEAIAKTASAERYRKSLTDYQVQRFATFCPIRYKTRHDALAAWHEPMKQGWAKIINNGDNSFVVECTYWKVS